LGKLPAIVVGNSIGGFQVSAPESPMTRNDYRGDQAV